MRRVVTNEEKAALKIIDAVDSSRLWNDLVGVYLFELSPPELFDKIVYIAQKANDEREKEIVRQQQPQPKLSIDPPF